MSPTISSRCLPVARPQVEVEISVLCSCGSTQSIHCSFVIPITFIVLQHLVGQPLFLLRDAMRKRGASHRPVSVCLSLSVRPSHSCVVSKRSKVSRNFFSACQPHHSSLFESIRRYKILRRTPRRGRLINVHSELFEIFGQYHAISRKRHKTGSWLPWNVNRKSQVPDRSLSVPTTSSDLDRRYALSTFFCR